VTIPLGLAAGDHFIMKKPVTNAVPVAPGQAAIPVHLPFAIVRPFWRGDFIKLMEQLESPQFKACTQQEPVMFVDMILYWGDNIGPGLERSSRLQRYIKVSAAAQKCFRRTTVRVVNLPNTTKYPMAPCHQFFQLFGLAGARTSTSLLGKYSAFFYMEPDVWALCDGWLSLVVSVAHRLVRTGGWLAGANWDSESESVFRTASASGVLPHPWRGHCRGWPGQCGPVNGNAIYSLSSTRFLTLLNQTSRCTDPRYDRAFFYHLVPRAAWAPPGGWMLGEQNKSILHSFFMGHAKNARHWKVCPSLLAVRARYPKAALYHGFTDCGQRGFCQSHNVSKLLPKSQCHTSTGIPVLGGFI